MNFAILISTIGFLTFSNAGLKDMNSVSIFDNSSYLETPEIEKVIDLHFVKDVHKESQLFRQFSGHFAQYGEVVDHITMNQIGTESISYYAIYKSHDETKSVELFKVDQDDFENEVFKKDVLEAMMPTRRYGFGFDFWCPPACDAYPVGSCLGFSC